MDRASWSYDPALAQQPGKPFSVDLRDHAFLPSAGFRVLCLIGNGLYQPILCYVKRNGNNMVSYRDRFSESEGDRERKEGKEM